MSEVVLALTVVVRLPNLAAVSFFPLLVVRLSCVVLDFARFGGAGRRCGGCCCCCGRWVGAAVLVLVVAVVVVVMSSLRSAASLEGEEDVEGLLEGSSGKI